MLTVSPSNLPYAMWPDGGRPDLDADVDVDVDVDGERVDGGAEEASFAWPTGLPHAVIRQAAATATARRVVTSRACLSGE
jgi:hypothetical protein